MGSGHRQIRSEAEVGWDEAVVEEPGSNWSFEPYSVKAAWKSCAEVEEWDDEETCHWAWEERPKPWAAGYVQRNYGVACEASHVEAGANSRGEGQHRRRHPRRRHHRHPCS